MINTILNHFAHEKSYLHNGKNLNICYKIYIKLSQNSFYKPLSMGFTTPFIMESSLNLIQRMTWCTGRVLLIFI